MITKNASQSTRPGRAALLAVCLSMAVTAGCDTWLGTQGRLERGQAELAAGDYVTAMADARTVLEREPGLAAGRILLARVMLKMGDAATARKEFDRAIAAGANPDSVRELHYDILAGEGRYEDVIFSAAADDALDAGRKRRLVAAALTASGKHGEALEEIDQALAVDPGDAELTYIRAQALWGAGRRRDALQVLDELIARRPDHARASLHRGRYALSLADPATARVAFERARVTDAAQLDMNERMAIAAGLVEAHIGTGDIAAAGRELAGLEAMTPGSYLSLYLKGRLAFARGDFRQATTELQRALAARPDMPFAQLQLGAALLQMGSLEQAEAELARLLASDSANSEARVMLARVYLARGDEEAARRILSAAPEGAGLDASISSLIGDVMLRAGQTDEGIALLKEAAAATPENVGMQLDLTRALLSAGRVAEAQAILAAVSVEAGGARRQQLMVLAEISGLSAAEGSRRVARLLEEHAQDRDVLATAGSYLLNIGENARAQEIFRQTIRLEPGHTEASLGLAAVAVRAGDSGEGERILKTIVDRQPEREQAYLALADIAVARRDPKAAQNWLERAVRANPAVVESRLRLLELDLVNGETGRSAALVEQLLQVSRQRPVMQDRIGRIYLRAGRYEQALARFQDAASQGFEGAGIGAARALLALGRDSEASSLLEAEARRHPASVEPVAMLVSLDLAARRFDQAFARVAALEASGRATRESAELRGHTQLASGDARKAAASFATAAAGRPSAGLAIKEFQARLAAGMSSPEAPLLRWLDNHPGTVGPRMILAGHYRGTGRNAEAIAQYERLLRFGQHPDALNNLAWIYHESGDARAAATAQRAYELAPNNAAIADTYGWILLQNGSADEGLRFLAEAARAAPQHPDIQAHHAAALARSGRSAEAATILRKLLASDTRFESRAQAQALMKELDR